MNFKVRKAEKNDLSAILELIQELADFENMPNGPTLKIEDLYKDGGFNGSSPLFFCFVAEKLDSTDGSPQGIVGYALCFYSYSTWQGRSTFLEDLYVKPDYRKKGIGQMLFTAVATNAKQTNCKRLELHVLDWNPAKAFYEKLGGQNLTDTEGWLYYRFDENAINRLINMY